MRIKLQFSPAYKDVITLPIQYNHLVQAMIYRHLEESLAVWMHDEGFQYYKRTFKLFTFSRLVGRFELYNKNMIFKGPVHLKISSPYTKFLESLAEYLVKAKYILLNRQKCLLNAVEVEMERHFETPALIKMLSPVTVYSTLKNGEGKKKTYYYSPWEQEFSKLIIDNIRKKASAYKATKNLPEMDGAYIKPVKVDGKRNFHIVKFKDFVIHGWSGIYELNLPPIYMRLAHDAGLGAKNSQGFGMMEIIE